MVVEITPVSITNIGYRTYIYFCVFNFAFLPLIYFFYPETRNLSLEQIDKLFTGEKVEMHWKASMDEGSGESADVKVVQESKSDSSRVDVAHRE